MLIKYCDFCGNVLGEDYVSADLFFPEKHNLRTIELCEECYKKMVDKIDETKERFNV